MLFADDYDDRRIALLCLFLGLFLLVFGLTSSLIRGRLYLSTAVIALLLGIGLGPKGARLLDILPSSWENGSESDKSKEALLWFTRVTLGVQVLSASVTLPKRMIFRPQVTKSLLTLLGPVLLFAVIIVAAFAKLIFKDLNWWQCLVIAGCLAPTDPVLAASVVKGTFAEKHVPPFIRNLILSESSVNDGSATPFIMLPVLILTSDSFIKDYVLDTLLWDTLFAGVAGFALGTVFRLAWDFAKEKKWVDKESRLVWTLALALFTTGLFTFIDSNELLSCFFCGTAMNWDGHLHEDDLHSHFSEGIDAILDVAVFTTLGTVLPWDTWSDPVYPVTLNRLALFGSLVILFRRMPVVFALQKFIPEVRSRKEAGFVGWFGPMGIGAIYYALKSGEMFPKEDILKQQLFVVVAFVVLLSTLIHGTTVPFFALGSALDPNLHPRFLVNNDSEADESSSLLSGVDRENQGHSITREELQQILNGDGDREVLDSSQRDALLGEGSGLAKWGRGKISVYNEGNKIVICDEEGHVSVRRIRA